MALTCGGMKLLNKYCARSSLETQAYRSILALRNVADRGIALAGVAVEASSQCFVQIGEVTCSDVVDENQDIGKFPSGVDSIELTSSLFHVPSEPIECPIRSQPTSDLSWRCAFDLLIQPIITWRLDFAIGDQFAVPKHSEIGRAPFQRFREGITLQDQSPTTEYQFLGQLEIVFLVRMPGHTA